MAISDLSDKCNLELASTSLSSISSRSANNIIRNTYCLTCPVITCNYCADRPYKISNHVKLIHENTKLYKCNADGCGKAFSSNSHLTRHSKQKHCKPLKEEQFYFCSECSRSYSNKWNLMKHERNVHPYRHKCTKCCEKISSVNQIYEHYMKHSGTPLNCHMCQKGFKSFKNYRRHLKRYATKNKSCLTKNNNKKIKEYICNNCNKSFKRRGTIIVHLKQTCAVERNKMFYCTFDNCQKSYTTNYNLKQHIRASHMYMRYLCDLCSKKFTTKAKLEIHISNEHMNNKKVKKEKCMQPRKRRKDFGTHKKPLEL